jgi:heavy metal sensor kinase
MNRFQSIRWRLQIWHGLLLIAVLAGFGVAIYRVESDRQFRRMDGELQRRLQALAAARRPVRGANPPRQEFRLPPENAALFGRGGDANFYYVVWLHGGNAAIRSATAPADVPVPAAGGSTTRLRGTLHEVSLSPAPGDYLLVGHPTDRDLAELHRLAWRLAVAAGGVLLLGLLGGAWLVHRALRPIQNISVAAQKIATGDLTQRISTDGAGSELGQLISVLNSTFARLDTAFAQQARFTADAAHELRTPVSVILAHAQYGLASACANDEHRDAFEASQRAAQRMRCLIESLLELARLDAGQESPRREECDLAAITADAIELIRPMAAPRGIHIHADLASAACRCDADRIAQVIANLLTNAIAYNHGGGEIRLSTRGGPGTATLTVANTGPGIPAEDLPRIFDRFHRADKARGGANGHSGLGLAITKAIVQAHGGSITATSETGKGAIFAVTLPR